MKYQGLENGKMRELTPEEVCAFYHFHNEYAELGLGAIEYYKGLSARDKQYIKDMTSAILKAAQHGVHPTRGSVAQKVSSNKKGSAKPARG